MINEINKMSKLSLWFLNFYDAVVQLLLSVTQLFCPRCIEIANIFSCLSLVSHFGHKICLLLVTLVLNCVFLLVNVVCKVTSKRDSWTNENTTRSKTKVIINPK